MEILDELNEIFNFHVPISKTWHITDDDRHHDRYQERAAKGDIFDVAFLAFSFLLP